MSIKWMLPWWLADPTNCRSLLLFPPLFFLFFLPPSPPPLALLSFSTWRSREWGFVLSGPMSPVKDGSSASSPSHAPPVRLPEPPTSTLGCKEKMDIKVRACVRYWCFGVGILRYIYCDMKTIQENPSHTCSVLLLFWLWSGERTSGEVFGGK